MDAMEGNGAVLRIGDFVVAWYTCRSTNAINLVVDRLNFRSLGYVMGPVIVGAKDY